MRLVIIFILCVFFGKAQLDSAVTVPLIGVNFGGQLPLGDMSARFGPNLRAGGSFLIKTKKNWVLGFESNYLFGKNVKEDVLKQMRTPEGYIVDNEGFPADVRVTERGITIHGLFGKVLRYGSTNPNSGLMILMGAGYMQHKVNIYDAQQKIAAVRGDRRNGYDRLTSGLSFTQFIGYLFLSERKILNFYFGFEFYEGFTSSVRKLNYDTGERDTAARLDVLAGFRGGWIIPLYKKRPNDFYYN